MSTRPDPCSLDRRAPIARRGAQAGFTLMEVMAALVVFVISVVGLVAMEGRSIEAQKVAVEIRQAERIAQEEMNEIKARGFLELLRYDFGGGLNPAFPYDDSAVPPNQRLRDLRRAFVPDGAGGRLVVQDNFIVFRTVDLVADPNAVPSVTNPPVLPPLNDPGAASDIPNIMGLEIEVLVLWIDRTNPTFPPPPDAKVQDLVPSMIDPTDANFAPWVNFVRHRTVRMNDVVVGGTP